MAAQEIISKHYAEDFSVLLLKAFPLEYEWRAPIGSEAAQTLERRRAAMIRHYRRVLRVEPLPGRPGEDGWMWRPLNQYAPMPAARPIT